MNTYLFLWNPKKWSWPTIEQDSNQFHHNFENKFGQIGKSFIHVHHLKQVATIGFLYEIDPVKDLRPVCPNCHSIIHKQKIALSIEDIKELIKQNEHNK